MTATWDDGAPGVLVLPSGRAVRGRALRRPLPPGPVPDFAVHLLGGEPPPVPWLSQWLLWRDFRLPTDPGRAREVLLAAWVRSADERVEVACAGGRGRTGTALACLAVLDGVPGRDAVEYVRQRYDHRAVETPWQRRFVARFPAQNAVAPRHLARDAAPMARRRQPTRLRIFGEYCCVWPVWGEGSDDVEAMVSPALRQDLLDWQQFWQDSQGVDGSWDTSEAEQEYLSRGRGLQHRLQRELDEPVEFAP